MFENVIDFSQIFNLRNAIIYLVIINLIAFFAMYIDKKKAKYGRWRIPEKTLLIIALLGGSIGTMIGMNLFRHKTQKLKFTLLVPLFLIIHIFLAFFAIRGGDFSR